MTKKLKFNNMLYTVLQAQESASEYVFVGFSLNHFG